MIMTGIVLINSCFSPAYLICRRVLYDVYFTKDTGHRHDWEWAVVKLVPSGDEQQSLIRAGVWLEQDGDHPYFAWNKLFTYTDGGGMVSGISS